jgi:hypothetical protein
VNSVAGLISRARADDAQAADELLSLVYDELYKLASAKMANEATNQTLQPTALVPESWLRVAGNHKKTTARQKIKAVVGLFGKFFTRFHAKQRLVIR